MLLHGVPFVSELAHHVVTHLRSTISRVSPFAASPKCFVPGCQPPGVVIGLPYHHAIEMLQLCGYLPGIGYAAIDRDGQMGKPFLSC